MESTTLQVVWYTNIKKCQEISQKYANVRFYASHSKNNEGAIRKVFPGISLLFLYLNIVKSLN
jgi:hypothetical protein